MIGRRGCCTCLPIDLRTCDSRSAPTQLQRSAGRAAARVRSAVLVVGSCLAWLFTPASTRRSRGQLADPKRIRRPAAARRAWFARRTGCAAPGGNPLFPAAPRASAGSGLARPWLGLSRKRRADFGTAPRPAWAWRGAAEDRLETRDARAQSEPLFAPADRGGGACAWARDRRDQHAAPAHEHHVEQAHLVARRAPAPPLRCGHPPHRCLPDVLRRRRRAPVRDDGRLPRQRIAGRLALADKLRACRSWREASACR